jgi:hypothetical protein
MNGQVGHKPLTMAEAVYQSVRLICATALLIALLSFTPELYRLWIVYDLSKVKLPPALRGYGLPGAETPVIRVEPTPREERL